MIFTFVLLLVCHSVQFVVGQLTPQAQGWPNGTANFQIKWQPCSNTTTSGPECGILQVPIDWQQPTGAQLNLGMMRVKASNFSSRKGSLLFNPGGPGVPATTLCQASSIAFSANLLQHFDLICPDPRGVGSSSPIRCDPEIWNKHISISPKNEYEFLVMAEWSKARGQSCLNMTGGLLRHVDTVSAAKDLEAIRLALNDGKLNWLGQSYGSLLGATYAELFPENVGYMVLDGIENHATDPATTLFIKSAAYQNELSRFFEWCATNATRCGLQGDDLPKMWDDLIVSANESPISATGCTGPNVQCKSTVSGDDILLNAQNLLIWQNTTLSGFLQGWDGLGQALNKTIARKDATAFSSRLAVSANDTIFAGLAIECLDWARFANVSANLSSAYATFSQLRFMSDAFNPSVGSYCDAYTRETTCVGWPIDPVDPQHKLNQTATAQLPPILMVNSNHDPFTSYVWAVGLKQQIPKATLLTRQGDGHTSYFLHGDASKVIDSFLVNGTMPKDGTVVYS